MRAALRGGHMVGLAVLCLSEAIGIAQQAPPPVPDPVQVRINVRAPRPISELPIISPPDNPASDARIALGRRLFFDPILSRDKTVSCSTCHEPDRAFADTKTLAVGVFGRVGRRHSPSLVNRGFGRAQFWDGRAATLEILALQPISDPKEMDLTLDEAVARVAASDSYQQEFQRVFERAVSGPDMGLAIAAFVRSIRSSDAPYDRFIAGDVTALTADQQAGLNLFRSKGRCVLCHAEPLFTDEAFRNTGVAWRVDPVTSVGAYQDEGRFEVTKQERDMGTFKVPTLREVARTAPYMHDGSVATLADVIDFYNTGGRPNRGLFPLIRPLGLTAEEKRQLEKFLEALSGTVTK